MKQMKSKYQLEIYKYDGTQSTSVTEIVVDII